MSDEMTKGTKAPRKKLASAPKPETCKVNVTLSVEAYRRLFVTSVMGGQTASAIVEALISEHLKSWSMPADLSRRGHSHVSANLSGPVEQIPQIADAA